MVLDRHIAFEQCVAKIFNKTGYGVEQEALVEHSYRYSCRKRWKSVLY